MGNSLVSSNKTIFPWYSFWVKIIVDCEVPGYITSRYYWQHNPGRDRKDTAMKLPVVQELNELIEADNLLRECMRPWDEQLQPHQRNLKKVIHWTALPAITVAVNRHFEGHEKTGSHLAAIFSLLFLADYIHCGVGDDDQGVCNDGFQFSILVGDYLFGKAMGLLNRINGHGLLQQFSQLICAVNEGHVMRKLANGQADCEILAREQASYYQYSFLTAAIAGGCGPLECKLYEETGHILGMAIALYNEGMDRTGASYLERTRTLLTTGFRPRNGKICVLRGLFDELIATLKPTREVVAI